MNLRRSQADEDHFDLLAFITILLCVLGTLLLVTVSVAALSLGPAAGELWAIASGCRGAETMEPILVEWDGQAVVVHWPERREVLAWSPVWHVEAGGRWYAVEWHGDRGLLRTPPRDRPVDRLLDRFAAVAATQYPVLAVRPSGFTSFEDLASEFRARGIPIGYRPIGQQKSVDLTVRRTDHENTTKAPCRGD